MVETLYVWYRTLTRMKTRILGIITQGELGGAQQFLTQLAHALDSERFEFSVAWGSSTGGDLANLLPVGTTTHKLTHLVRALNPWHDMRAISEIQDLIARTTPHIVLAMSSKAGFVASWAVAQYNSRHPHAPIASVYRIGGWAFNDPRPWWERALYRTLERLSARHKDIIVVNNTHDLEQARRIGIKPKRRLLCIHNGIAPLQTPPHSKEEARIELSKLIPTLDTTRPIVGTIANFYATKDIPNLLRAATELDPATQVVVVGDGPERGHIEDIISLLHLETRVFLVGRIAGASHLLPAFDVFALPSRKEGFAWVLLEAMRASVPIVATSVGSAPEIITHGHNGILIAPGQWRELGQALRSLIADKPLQASLSQHAQQDLTERFSVDRMTREFTDVFSSLRDEQ